MLDPDNGDPFSPRLHDKPADVHDDRIALMSSLDDAVLYVDDEECGVRPVLKCAHLVSPLPSLPLENISPSEVKGVLRSPWRVRDQGLPSLGAQYELVRALLRCRQRPDQEGGGAPPRARAVKVQEDEPCDRDR